MKSRSQKSSFLAVVALLLSMTIFFSPNRAAAAGGGSITLRSQVCPASFDGAEATIYDLAANCHDPAAHVPLNIYKDGALIDASNTNADGSLNYVGFPGGQISVDETAPAGTFVRAFCAIYSETSGDRAYLEYKNPASNTLNPGDNFDCDIYDVAYAAPARDSVYVAKHNCPVGFDVYKADMNGLAAGCHDGGTNGVTFTLSDTANPAVPAVTTNGVASWAHVPASAVSIVESVPSGYLVGRVFCNFKNAAGDESGFNDYTPPTTGVVNFNAQPGYDTFCDWYDRKLAPGTTVTSLDGGNAAAATQPADPTVEATAQPTQPSGDGNSQTGTPVAVQTVPATRSGNSSVTFRVFDCPPGYDVLKASADPSADCAAAAANAPFMLAGNGRSINGASGSDGTLALKSLAAGRYELTESLPAGVTSAFIGSCTSSQRTFDQTLVFPFARIGSSGKLVFNLRDKEDLDCTWFNAPAKSSTSGGTSIKIDALTCPGASVVLAQCTPDASAVAITFTPSDSSLTPVTLTTNASGVAVGRIKPGTYAFAPAGGSFCFVDSQALDGSGNLVVIDQAIAMTVYRCGA